MELGSWSLISYPSIFGLIPLALYVILSIKMTKNMFLPIVCSVFAAMLMAGLNPTQVGTLIVNSLGGLMGQVGLICMMGAGLGGVMSKVGVTETLCSWIIRFFHINNKRKAMFVIAVVAFLMSLVVGSSATAAAIFIPFIVPVAAKFKIRPVTVTTIDFIVGFAGMSLSPFSATNIAAMEITGLTFFEYLRWAAGPYVVVTAVSGLWLAFWIDKKLEKDSTAEIYEIEEGTESAGGKNAVAAALTFVVVFFVSVIYMIFFGGGLAFTILYLLGLMIMIALAGKCDIFEALNIFCEKCGTMFNIFVTLVLLQVLLDIIDIMGGFVAFGEICQRMVVSSGDTRMFLIIATLFGVFGINGAAAAQMAVIEGVFSKMLPVLGVSAGTWAMVLLMGSLPSNFLYPGSTHWTALGIARSSDLKNLLKVCWIEVAIEILVAIIYCLILG